MVKASSSNRPIVSFHIGTVNTRISVATNSEGESKILRVHHPFPGDSSRNPLNIPSCIAYDEAGNVRGAGAEIREDTLEKLQFARCFKLHLLPTTTPNATRAQNRYPLPAGKTVVDVYSDFLRYLKDSALTYLAREHPHFDFAPDEVFYVLSYPCLHAIPILEEATLKAELITPANSQKRLHFVDESEAAAQILPELVWLLEDDMQEKEAFIIVKVGAGTLSVGTFCVETTAIGSSSLISSLTATESYLEGSLLVTERARLHIDNLLRDSHYHSSVGTIMQEFDARTKLGFRHFKGYQYIPFGASTDHDEENGVRYGHLVLRGTDVARFFEPSISCVVRSVLNQVFSESTNKKRISTIVLLGGLFQNEWVSTRLRDTLEALGLECHRPSMSRSDSAVCDGAIQWCLYKELNPLERISQYHYGIRIPIPYDQWDDGHVSRSWEAFRGMDGRLWLTHYFSVILPKGESSPETKEYRHTFTTQARRRTGLDALNITILRHQGSTCPVWANNPIFDGFETACTVYANTAQASRRLQACKSPFKTCKGWSYYKLSYDVIIRFGPNEFTAQLAWNEDGRERRGEVYTITDDS